MTDTNLGAAAGDIFAKAFTLGYETGRNYIPAGGMALTAEQVEDVRTVVNNSPMEIYDAKERGLYYAAAARLRALFPATEPAEDAPCMICNVNETNHAGVSYYHPFTTELGPFDDDGNDRPAAAEPAAAVRDGSDLVVVQRSHTAKAVQSWMTLDLWTDLGKNDKDFDAEYERQGFGDLWATLLGEVRALVQATTPAPAEPAEEETKAEVGGDFIEIVFDGPPEAVSGRFVEVENPQGASISVGEWIDRGDGFWALRIPYPSSPVVSAPTETGPWQTWESVPDDVWFTSASAVGFLPAHRKRGSLVDWKFRDGSVGVYDVSRIGNGKLMARAPFVAAEEG